jgi:hypothetical protein
VTIFTRIKENFRDFLLVIGALVVAILAFIFKRRGDRIDELEHEKNMRDLKDETKQIEEKIETQKGEVKENDKKLNEAITKFNASRDRFLKLRRDMRGKFKEGGGSDTGV